MSQLIGLVMLCLSLLCSVSLYQVRGTFRVDLTHTRLDLSLWQTHTDSKILFKPETMNAAMNFQVNLSLVLFSIFLPRVPSDPSSVRHCTRELPVDCGGFAGGGAHQTSWRKGSPSVGLQIVLPLPAAAHHPGCWIFPAHPSLHGEPGHHPDVCCRWDLVERLLRRRPAVCCVSDSASQSIWPPPTRAPSLPAVWLHHLCCGSCCCASCFRGDPYQWTVAHSGVWRVTAQWCCHCGE